MFSGKCGNHVSIYSMKLEDFYFLYMIFMVYMHSDSENRVLSWDERLQIALDICHGVEYLHEGVF